jgi:hypothetical protein
MIIACDLMIAEAKEEFAEFAKTATPEKDICFVESMVQGEGNNK